MSFKEKGTSPTTKLLLILLPTGWNEDLMDVMASYMLDHVDGQHTVWDNKTENTCVPNTRELPYPPLLLTYGLLWEEEINFYLF